MSTEQVAQTVREYLEALGSGVGLEPFLTEDATLVTVGDPDPLRGAAAVDRGVRHHYGAEFDARTEIVGIVADANGAATELRFVGTHIGEYWGIPATGRAVDVPLSMFFDVQDGRISAIRIYYSPERLLRLLRE